MPYTLLPGHYIALPSDAMNAVEINNLREELDSLRDEIQEVKKWSTSVTANMKEILSFVGWQHFLSWLWHERYVIEEMKTWFPFLNWLWEVRHDKHRFLPT